MTIRPIGPGDADALEALWASLPPDDRRRRFFTAATPPRSVVERWVRVGQHGGYAVVALVDRAPDAYVRTNPPPELVGDAGYVPLPDGSGELAVTVAPSWRGWLGPFLLDAVLTAAAARGIRSLQALVLRENRPMLAIARARGWATLNDDDWLETRLLLPTAGHVPCWPPRHDRLRLVVEAAGGRWHQVVDAQQAGFDVVACPGPSALPRRRCPLLDAGTCPLVEDADVVVVALPAADPARRLLVDAHRRRRAGPPTIAAEAPGTPPGAHPATRVRPRGRRRTGIDRGPSMPPERRLMDVALGAIAAVAPDAALAGLGLDDDLVDELGLDSIDVVGIVDAVAERTGIEVPGRRYPELRTLRGFVAVLDAEGRRGVEEAPPSTEHRGAR
jgi:hypothetical protein